MMLLRAALTAILLFVSAPCLLAVEPDEILTDKALEQRARAISEGLRCLVCQNQSIDDSNAPLARDLRLIVRERLKAGDSDPAVVDFIVRRYGDFVLLKPPLTMHTVLLWLAPLLVLIAAAAVGWRSATRRAANPNPAPRALSVDEERRLGEVLSGDQDR